MTEDAHDLTPPGQGEGDPLALAFRSALDGGPARRDAATCTTLASVQARATRRHRRRLAASTLGTAAVLAAALAVVPGVLPSQPSAPPSGLTAPTEAPAPAPDPTAAPGPTDADEPFSTVQPPDGADPAEPADSAAAAVLLTLEQVQQALPGAQVIEEPGPLANSAEDGLCTTEFLDGLPASAAAWSAAWSDGPVPEADAALPDSAREEVRTFESPADARTYQVALLATVEPCTVAPEETGPYEVLESPSPEEGGGEDLVAAAALVEGQWRVRVVTVEGSAVVSLSADVTAPDRTTAVVAVNELAQVASRRAVQP